MQNNSFNADNSPTENRNHPSLPRLLFATGSTEDIEPYFYLSAVAPWIHALSQHFNILILKSQDHLLAEAAEFKPDLLLFFGAKSKLLYTGPVFDFRVRLGIPVAALTLMDGHSPAKQPFFEQAWRLGVEAVFSIDTGMREMAGGFESSVFYCPWFVNEKMCRDFGEEKTIPIALVGDGFVSSGNDWRYPWRRNVMARLRKEFPLFSSPRPSGVFPHAMVGENYARMLNRSWLALSCGASRHIFMKKNLEIPASRCCLVTEPNESLIELGFKDMENCVFATEDSIVEKCKMLLEDQDTLLKLTDRGRKFVLDQHSSKNRTVIAEWLALRQNMEAGDSIRQTDLFQPLVLQKPGKPDRPSIQLSSNSPFIRAMHEAGVAFLQNDAALCAGHAAFAESLLPYTPEPHFYQALCALVQHTPGNALRPLVNALGRSLTWGAESPDPLLWATYILTLNFAGDVEKSKRMAEMITHLNHPVLNAVRKALLPGLECPGPDELENPSAMMTPWRTDSERDAFLNPLLQHLRESITTLSQPTVSRESA